jgi:hypothetical protein
MRGGPKRVSTNCMNLGHVGAPPLSSRRISGNPACGRPGGSHRRLLLLRDAVGGGAGRPQRSGSCLFAPALPSCPWRLSGVALARPHRARYEARLGLALALVNMGYDSFAMA